MEKKKKEIDEKKLIEKYEKGEEVDIRKELRKMVNKSKDSALNKEKTKNKK